MVTGIKIAVLILLVIAPVTYEQDTSVYPSPCPHIYEYEPPETEPDLWSAVVLISTDSLLYYLWLNIVLDRPALHLRNPIGKVVTKNNIDFRIESDIRIFPGRPIPLRFSIKYDPTNGVPKLRAIRLNGKVICKDDTLEITTIKPARIIEQTTLSTTTSTTEKFIKFEDSSIETFKFNKTFLEMTGNLNLPWVQSFGDYQVGGVLTTTQRNPWTTTRRSYEIEDYRGYRVDELHSAEKYTYGGDSSISYNPQGSYTQAPQRGVVEPPCGTPTAQNAWPWMAAIYKLEGVNYLYRCGGSLISHRHVITVAHCVRLTDQENNKRTLYMVHVGKENLLTSNEGGQSGLVQRIVMHPDFLFTKTVHRDDLAILELYEPVKYTEWVRRVCLWPRQSTELEGVIGKTGWLSGWGYTQGHEVTENSHAVQMNVLSYETCALSNPNVRQLIPNNMSHKFCAGNNADSVCLAASSGSGLYYKVGQRWHLRGAVSLTLKSKDPAKKMLKCDSSQIFIFTDYAKYLPWIRLFTYDL